MVLPGDQVDDVADIKKRSKLREKRLFYRKNPRGQKEFKKGLI